MYKIKVRALIHSVNAMRSIVVLLEREWETLITVCVRVVRGCMWNSGGEGGGE